MALSNLVRSFGAKFRVGNIFLRKVGGIT